MKSDRKPRIIFNDDTCSLRFVPPPHPEDKISLALAHLRNSQVDCLCWNLYSGDVAYSWPSRVCENYFDLAAKEFHGNTFRLSRNLLLTLHQQGIDYLPLLIERAHAEELQIYGSFRMNDSHHKSAPDSYLASEFWRTHQHYRLWEVTDGRTYYNATLDYSYPEVRQRKLDAIAEVLEMYELDGLEMDWCRNPYTFQPSEAWDKRLILMEFMTEVRELVRAAGSKRNRALGLIVRVPFSEEKLHKAGMDIEDWIRRGLMDILVMSNHTNNYNLRVGNWPKLCREHGVLFYPSLEAGPATNAAHNVVVPQTVDECIRSQRAAARNFLSQDCDGIYMFNYPCMLFESRRTDTEFADMAAVLSELGAPETLQGTPKRYTFWENLPMQLESARPPQYHQTISFALRDPDLGGPGMEAVLQFRQVAEKNPHSMEEYWQKPVMPPGWVTYLLNGTEIGPEHITRSEVPAGAIPSGFKLRKHELVRINVPGEMLVNGENALAFHIRKAPHRRDPYVHIYELVAETRVRSG